MAWQQKITQNSGLSARKLAVEESVPVTSVTRHLHLLNLPTHIQDFLKQLHDAKAMHFFSLRKLDPISALSLENQLEDFDLLRRRFPD